MRVRTALEVFHVTSREALWEHFRLVLAAARLRMRPVDLTVTAYVSENRWVADCPDCNGGMAVLPGEPDAVCLGCGTRCHVRMPAHWQLAEFTLAVRPVEYRHWFPQHGETIETLARENIAHLTEAL